MTSSLVGSEMCIRDRVSGVSQWLRPLLVSLMLVSPVVPCLASQCARSVSYTHLTLPTICSV
eukprot:3555625-Prorocentrum_lima.AAC.1